MNKNKCCYSNGRNYLLYLLPAMMVQLLPIKRIRQCSQNSDTANSGLKMSDTSGSPMVAMTEEIKAIPMTTDFDQDFAKVMIVTSPGCCRYEPEGITQSSRPGNKKRWYKQW